MRGANVKRGLVVVCALALLLQSAGPLAAGKRATDTSGAVSVEIPKGWRVDRNLADCVKLTLLGTAHKGVYSYITLVTKKADKLSLDTVAKGIEKDPSILDKGCKIISHSTTKLGGTPALAYMCESAPAPSGAVVWFETVIAIRGKTAYLLSYSAAKDFFKVDKPALDTVMKSFKWV